MAGTYQDQWGRVCNVSVNVNVQLPDGLQPIRIRKNPRVGVKDHSNAEWPEDPDEKAAVLQSDNNEIASNDNTAKRAHIERYNEHKGNPHFYQMTHFYKGRVLIINNNFAGTKDMREGSTKDVEDLKRLFDRIGNYSVMSKEDLSAKEILSAVHDFAKCAIEQSFCAIFIMSHGKAADNRDVLVGTNNTLVNVKELVDALKSDSYLHLKEVPVLLFFQMCRGKLYDRRTDHFKGVESHMPGNCADVADDYENDDWLSDILAKILPSGEFLGRKVRAADVPDASEDTADETGAEHIGKEKNMLVSFSTMEGYKSYRNRTEGSWFIQDICSVFRRHAEEEDIIALMNRVHDLIDSRVAYCPGCKEHGSRVCGRTTHTLGNKKLFLFPGLP